VGTGLDAHWLIAAAVDTEIQAMRKHLKDLSPGKINTSRVWKGLWKGERICLLRTGVGPKKAGRTLKNVLSGGQHFQGIISIGFAGALNSGYKVGDIVIPEEIQTVSPLPEKRFAPDRDLFQKACDAARQQNWRFHTDRMITSVSVISDCREKDLLGKKHDAGSVEMESAVIAENAVKASIPFVVVRVILDEVNFSLPDALQVLGWVQKKEFVRVILYCLKEPVQAARLIILGKNSYKAARQMTRFLMHGFF